MGHEGKEGEHSRGDGRRNEGHEGHEGHEGKKGEHSCGDGRRNESHEGHEGNEGLKCKKSSQLCTARLEFEVFMYRSDRMAYGQAPRPVCLSSQAEGGVSRCALLARFPGWTCDSFGNEGAVEK